MDVRGDGVGLGGLPEYIVLLPQRNYVMTDLKTKSTLQDNCFRLVRTTGTKAGVFHPHPDSKPPVTHTYITPLPRWQMRTERMPDFSSPALISCLITMGSA